MSNAYINDFNTTVQTYYKELKKCNPISKEKQFELIKRAKKNDLKAKNTILTSNLKFVFDVAKNYKGCGVPLEDLISEGNLRTYKSNR
jgi:RNA polymerase primary sigma factor